MLSKATNHYRGSSHSKIYDSSLLRSVLTLHGTLEICPRTLKNNRWGVPRTPEIQKLGKTLFMFCDLITLRRGYKFIEFVFFFWWYKLYIFLAWILSCSPSIFPFYHGQCAATWIWCRFSSECSLGQVIISHKSMKLSEIKSQDSSDKL